LKLAPDFKRPTQVELQAANGKTVPDIIAPGLRVLFCGINPGLYSAAVGHHFAHPGNRFWPALHTGGFTPRIFSPFEEKELLPFGLGITNIVNRATAGADELTRDELVAGAAALIKKLEKYRPKFLAVLGVGAYRAAFENKQAMLGLQPPTQMPVKSTRIWVLPNPSGLNAHYRADALAHLFGELNQSATALD